MCGILGIYGEDDVQPELAHGITALQHRGQDATGMVTFDKTFHVLKAHGLASDVFSQKDGSEYKGNIGLAHVRYATQGTTKIHDAQPFTINYPYGLAMVHNGNVTNFESLRHTLGQKYNYLIETSNDIELLLYMLAWELAQNKGQVLTPDVLFDAVTSVQRQVEGAYATITLIANQGLLAFMDPHGIRPLILGRRESHEGVSYAFASETRCFDYLGYEDIHQLKPGEAVFIDTEKRIHSKQCSQKKQAFCVFEQIYLAKEDSRFYGDLVASQREDMGKLLARYFNEKGLTPDVVIDVPSSGYFFAQGLAEALGVLYKKGLVKNNQAKRSFIAATQPMRELIVRQKLNPLKDVLSGKRVAVVDDSIVRGTTSKRIVSLIRSAGAKEIYFVSGAPPVKHPCIYGVDMNTREEMIAAQKSIEEIQAYIGADALIYPSVGDLRALFSNTVSVCDACFSGEYPTQVTDKLFSSMADEKLLSCR